MNQLPQRGISAHRGETAVHPENTLPAFREAVRLGAHQIELDVVRTKDNQLVIVHDETVNRFNAQWNLSAIPPTIFLHNMLIGQ